MTPSRWAQVRAALLAVAVGSHLLVAIPVGPRVTEASLRKPAAQEEIEVWMELFGPLGFSKEEFEDWVVRWSDRLVTTSDAVKAPVRKVLKVFRQGQAWGLFAATDRSPQRLEVRGKDAEGNERLLYARLDPEHDFLRPWLDYRRVRGVFDISNKSPPPRYKNFATWVARRAFEAHPDLVEVTVTQVEIQVRLPSEKPDPSTADKLTQVRTRAEVLGEGVP